MAGSNGYANMVRARTEKKAAGGKRRKLDDYETPAPETRALLRCATFSGATLEPAAGSGRMADVLRSGIKGKVFTADIKNGNDFLKRTKPFAGNIITNPPYHEGMAERFTRHALELADGKVAMLVEGKFLWGSKRARDLFKEFPPECVVILPGRVYFFEGGGAKAKQITSQFYSHCWVVFPDRKTRARGGTGKPTATYWGVQDYSPESTTRGAQFG